MLLTRSQYENMSKFSSKYDKVHSQLEQCKKFNSYLLKKIIQMEHNAVTNLQYSRKETTELNSVPADIKEDVLEETIFKALSLTVKFKCCKQKNYIMDKCKILGDKFLEEFSLVRVCHENQQLEYKCQQLKSTRMITWFFS